jgi:hypothetical protein
MTMYKPVRSAEEIRRDLAAAAVLAPLTTNELDELSARLFSAGHTLERHSYYTYENVPQDYRRTLETWRENNQLQRDVIRELDEDA